MRYRFQVERTLELMTSGQYNTEGAEAQRENERRALEQYRIAQREYFTALVSEEHRRAA